MGLLDNLISAAEQRSALQRRYNARTSLQSAMEMFGNHQGVTNMQNRRSRRASAALRESYVDGSEPVDHS